MNTKLWVCGRIECRVVLMRGVLGGGVEGVPGCRGGFARQPAHPASALKPPASPVKPLLAPPHPPPAPVQAMEDLDWAPEFGLLEGLMDSYDKDFGRGTYRKEPDYTTGGF